MIHGIHTNMTLEMMGNTGDVNTASMGQKKRTPDQNIPQGCKQRMRYAR